MIKERAMTLNMSFEPIQYVRDLLLFPLCGRPPVTSLTIEPTNQSICQRASVSELLFLFTLCRCSECLHESRKYACKSETEIPVASETSIGEIENELLD
jgi:hypothetical protein